LMFTWSMENGEWHGSWPVFSMQCIVAETCGKSMSCHITRLHRSPKLYDCGKGGKDWTTYWERNPFVQETGCNWSGLVRFVEAIHERPRLRKHAM
jgi:hypothetical protein